MEIPEKERKRGRGKRGEIMKEAERKTRQTRLTQSDDGRHMSSASNILGITDFKSDEIKTVKDPRLCIEVIRIKKLIPLKYPSHL